MRLSKRKHLNTSCLRTSVFYILVVSFIGCSTPDSTVSGSQEDSTEITDHNNPIETVDLRYLALGDSYTIGTGVCDTCSYPEQLTERLLNLTDPVYNASVKIVANTGWTTTQLLQELEARDIEKNFNLVTLLIGVNNQFQGGAFERYEEEFIQLLNQAIQFAQGNEDQVIVLSIPDYAFSPFGQNWGNPETTSNEIDTYNTYAKSVCENIGISFVNVTDISRQALERPELLADDGLHLSELAYAEFAERLLPLVKEKTRPN